MIRAENLPRVIETSAVRLYFCHDWAMAEPEDFISRAAGKPFQFKHSFHSEVGMHTASSPSLNRWKTLYQAAILETNKGLLPQRVSEAEEAVKARGREIFYADGTLEKEAEALEDALYTSHAFRTAWQHREPA